jgi:hypothetical protein
MTQNAEAEKQRYARELAAYTLQQWNLARERQADREKERKKTDPAQSKRSSRPATPADANLGPDDEATEAAVKAVDYAIRTAPKHNGDT